MRARCFLFSLIFIFFTSSSYAGPLYAVEDIKSLEKLKEQIQYMNQEFNKMKDMYNEMQTTLDQTKRIQNDLSGHYQYGQLLNDAQQVQNQFGWTASNWDDALKGLSGGNDGRYQELVNEYQRDYPSLAKNDYERGASPERADIYEKNVTVNQTAVTQASYEFANLNKISQQIKDLTNQIDSATSAKQVLDLNARITAEVAYIQLEELRMTVLLNQQSAQLQSTALSSNMQSASYLTLK